MKLLVSVRDRDEAEVALEAEIDLLDIKEPLAGPLGATDPALWAEIEQLAAGRVPVSAALGELRDWGDSQSAFAAASLRGLAFAKVGLAGMAGQAKWPERWLQFAQALPAGVQPVAVAYADAHLAEAPPWQRVLDQAVVFGWRTLLVDTYDKQQGGLLDHLPLAELEQVLTQAEAAGMRTVLAGSLRLEDISRLATLPRRPNFIAVRGAVCGDGRASPLDQDKLKALRQLLYDHGRKSPRPAGLPF